MKLKVGDRVRMTEKFCDTPSLKEIKDQLVARRGEVMFIAPSPIGNIARVRWDETAPHEHDIMEKFLGPAHKFSAGDKVRYSWQALESCPPLRKDENFEGEVVKYSEEEEGLVVIRRADDGVCATVCESHLQLVDG